MWCPSYQSHIDRIERIQRSYSRFVLWKYGFRNIPHYYSRCKLLGIESLANRRAIANCIFMFDIISSKIDSPDLLQCVDICDPPRPLRFYNFLNPPFHRVNYGCFAPLSRCTMAFNSLFELIDFNLPREVLIKGVRLNVYCRDWIDV